MKMGQTGVKTPTVSSAKELKQMSWGDRRGVVNAAHTHTAEHGTHPEESPLANSHMFAMRGCGPSESRFSHLLRRSRYSGVL